jgi:hypothetical protein
MPKWTEYTSKNTLADNDEVMLYDATGKANKRGLMSKFWDYVVDKMSTAVISKLETKNKTVIGAINALNSETTHKINITANTKYSIPIGYYYSAIILGTIGGAYCVIRIHNAPNNPSFSYILKDNWVSNPEISIVSNECNPSQFTFTTPTNTAGFVWY